jgi:hypothetical protein
MMTAQAGHFIQSTYPGLFDAGIDEKITGERVTFVIEWC